MRRLAASAFLLLACGPKPEEAKPEPAKDSPQVVEVGAQYEPSPDCPGIFEGIVPPNESPIEAEARAIEKAAGILQRDQKQMLSPDEATEFARELTQARKATLLHLVGMERSAERTLEPEKLETFRKGSADGFRSLAEGTKVMLMSLEPYDHAPLDPFRNDLQHMKTIALFHLGEAEKADVEKFGGPECMRRPVDDATLDSFVDLRMAKQEL